MPMFICRWPNGNFSAVNARSGGEAITLLDEFANADGCDLFIVKDFMVHFHLKKEVDDLEYMVPVELGGFGAETYDRLCDRVYPIYSKAAMECTNDWPAYPNQPTQEQQDAARKRMEEALTTERDRQLEQKEPVISADLDVARLQESHNLPKVIAENIVRRRRREQQRKIMDTKPTGKVQ